ncbi:MAG: DNA recombination protein RmuC [Phascolarctobacterium sp.]|nr:DNA recombination protein RmuC [Phascolarctobacterium sp.]MBR2039024.1 DNA recombination protein RmuC [Phascolarctobacterium sp.]
MDIQIILLVALGAILLVLLALLVIVIKRGRDNEADKLEQRLEYLERSLNEALRDLRGEQNNLARAARMESQANNDRLSEQIDKRVARLADLTDKNLERIRTTVDDKLNENLEQRFTIVSKRLEDLHRNLGEMQNLAGGVDELKRILTNVKTRGIWGEMQLAKLLYDVLPKTRVAENVEVVPHSGERVEFALRLPGSDTLHEILLPIDAKFPQEDYLRLQQAREEGRSADAEEALKKLERRLKKEAKDISEKYICPPHSTDFGVMYLPSEGLYLQALNMTGLVEELQKTYRVCVAGPSTLAALVNSLQMGFRTLAVQERTDEVWRLLAAVKQDMESLAAALDKTSKKLEETSASVGTANRKVHSISKRLQDVESGEDI